MYHIIEIQTNGSSSQIVTPIPSAENLYEADSIFYQKMSYAAISQVPVHSVVMIDENGLLLRNGSYNHSEQQEE